MVESSMTALLILLGDLLMIIMRVLWVMSLLLSGRGWTWVIGLLLVFLLGGWGGRLLPAAQRSEVNINASSN